LKLVSHSNSKCKFKYFGQYATYLNIEVLLEGLEFGVQLLIWIGHVALFSLDSPLESFENVCLHVVRMEFGFRFLVFIEHGSHILSNALLLLVHGVHDVVVSPLLLHVDSFHLGHPLTKSTELLDSWGELGLLLLDVALDLLDKSGQFL